MIKSQFKNSLLLAGLLFSIPLAFADTPASLTAEHAHAVTTSGKLTLFRAQIKGLEIGPSKDRLDAEVLVTLDSTPDKVYGVRLHEDEPSAREIINTLREAYLHNIPVTIQSPLEPGRNNLRINWVQLGK
jgi:hypothetical protein